MIKKIFFILLLVAICGFSNSQTAVKLFLSGRAKADLKDYRGAIADYDKALEFSPEYINPYFFRGIAKEVLKEYRGAIADYSKIIEMDLNGYQPSEDDQKFLLEDNIGTILYCSKYIYPLKAIAYLKRARAKADIKDYRGAMEDYNKLIEIMSGGTGYLNRALAKADLKDYRGAIADYDKAIEIDSKCTFAYLNRGLAKVMLGRTDSACLDLSKAGELGAENAYELIQKYCN
jgi:tetratricopeptide (TPR) repeat protein